MARTGRLGVGASRKIASAIDTLFDNAKARLLGPQSIVGKKIHIGYIREMSLPGIFEAGSLEEMVKPDLDVLDSLIRVAGSYVDAHRERTKARTIHEINGAIAEARHNGGMSQSDFRGLVNTKLSEVWSDVTRNIHSVVDTELSHAKNVSVLDGVIGSNVNAGIADPVVYFVVVRDNILCKECKRLHLMDDEKTPRLWYLSELGHGYHKKGEDSPKIGGLHPHCRCTLVTLLPSYGFTNDGMVKYVKRGHLELPAQRGLAQSEPEVGEPMEKALSEIPVGPEVDTLNEEDNRYDYSHLLSPEQKQRGFKIHVTHSRWSKKPGMQSLTANLIGPKAYLSHEAAIKSLEQKYGINDGSWPDHKKQRYDSSYKDLTVPHDTLQGHALGYFGDGILEPHFNDGISPELRGMKFGSALYGAMFAHAKNALGAHTVKGGRHSVEAGMVHQSLSRQHGMNYEAKTLRVPNPIPENSHYNLLTYYAPGAKKAKGPYQYALKGELSPNSQSTLARIRANTRL
jgi:hypothetical protein